MILQILQPCCRQLLIHRHVQANGTVGGRNLEIEMVYSAATVNVAEVLAIMMGTRAVAMTCTHRFGSCRPATAGHV